MSLKYCWYCKESVFTDKLFHDCGQMYIGGYHDREK